MDNIIVEDWPVATVEAEWERLENMVLINDNLIEPKDEGWRDYIEWD